MSDLYIIEKIKYNEIIIIEFSKIIKSPYSKF